MKQRGYICGIAWQHELAEDIDNSVAVYTSADELRWKHQCSDECGIVEIEMREVRWVTPQNLAKRRVKMNEVIELEGKFYVWYLPEWEILAIGPDRFEVYTDSAFEDDVLVRFITQFPERWVKVGEF